MQVGAGLEHEPLCARTRLVDHSIEVMFETCTNLHRALFLRTFCTGRPKSTRRPFETLGASSGKVIGNQADFYDALERKGFDQDKKRRFHGLLIPTKADVCLALKRDIRQLIEHVCFVP